MQQHEDGEDPDCDDEDRQLCLSYNNGNKKMTFNLCSFFTDSNYFSNIDFAIWQTFKTMILYKYGFIHTLPNITNPLNDKIINA